jgi:hypothetical protein
VRQAEDELPEELSFEQYRFRVGRMHFELFEDAQFYCESSLAQCGVDVYIAPGWRRLWTDGEVVFNRPGFGCHVPYVPRVRD